MFYYNSVRKSLTVSFLLIVYLLILYLPGFAQDAQSFYKNGYQYFSQGNYQKAEENYKKAIELDSNFEDAHYWLGKVYRQTGQYDKAISQWIEVLRINPRNPYAFRYLNGSFRNTSGIQDGNAQDYFMEGLRRLEITDDDFLNENNYSGYELLVATPYFKKAIELKNDFSSSHYWLGEIYNALSKKISWQYTSMAINSFEEVIKIEEKLNNDIFNKPSIYWHAYQELIDIYQSLGLNERSDNLFTRLQEVRAVPYNQALAQAGFDEIGYPDYIEIIKEGQDVIELWKYEEENKIFRVVNKEVKGEEISHTRKIKDENSLEENNTTETEVTDEGEL